MTFDKAAIEERLKAATPGPWAYGIAGPGLKTELSKQEMIDYLAENISFGSAGKLYLVAVGIEQGEVGEVDKKYLLPAVTGNGPTSEANAVFIAAAPTDLAACLAEIDRLTQVIVLLDETKDAAKFTGAIDYIELNGKRLDLGCDIAAIEARVLTAADKKLCQDCGHAWCEKFGEKCNDGIQWWPNENFADLASCIVRIKELEGDAIIKQLDLADGVCTPEMEASINRLISSHDNKFDEGFDILADGWTPISEPPELADGVEEIFLPVLIDGKYEGWAEYSTHNGWRPVSPAIWGLGNVITHYLRLPPPPGKD